MMAYVTEILPSLVAASKHPCVHANSRYVQTYVDGKMTIQELENYDCVEATGHIVPEYWGNFSGPCCKPKSSLHSRLDPSRTKGGAVEQKDVRLAD